MNAASVIGREMASPGGERTPMPLPPPRLYSVVCNHRIGRRLVDRIISRHLPLEGARALAEQLQNREKRRKALWSSWTGRLFGPMLEK